MARPNELVDVTLRGPLFTKAINKTVQRAIVDEAMAKIEKRLRRRGRTLGRKRNPIGPGEKKMELGGGVTMLMSSSLHRPRTTGYAWVAKNIAIIKAMAPRVLRSTARRIVGELNG